MSTRGDFNDIISHEDKQRRNQRAENFFNPFRGLIQDMEMGEISFRERRWTWANNRHDEGFIKERLDMFFRSVDWLLSFDQAVVQHILT